MYLAIFSVAVFAFFSSGAKERALLAKVMMSQPTASDNSTKSFIKSVSVGWVFQVFFCWSVLGWDAVLFWSVVLVVAGFVVVGAGVSFGGARPDNSLLG